MCHPIGYGLERLDSKLGYMYRVSSDNNWGRFFFFFSRRWREGLEDDYLWEAITLNTVKFRKQAPGLIFFKGPF